MKDLYPTMPGIAVEFLNYMLTIRGKSDKTVLEYLYDLRTFFRWIRLQSGRIPADTPMDEIDISDMTIEDLRPIGLAELYAYVSYRSRHLGNSSITRARKVASVKSFFKYLHSKAKLIDVNPAAELDSPKVIRRLPKYLNLDESRNLLESISGANEVRDYAIVTLFMNCGLRLSELVGIDIGKIRDDRMTVIGKGSKERTVYLNDACQDAIRSWREIRDKMEGVKDRNALFLSNRKTRISPKTVQVLVKNHIRASGLDPEKYSAHKLRHTAATLMYKHGHVDIRALQQILGHESIATTEIYTHVDEQHLREAVRANPLSGVRSAGRKKKESDESDESD